MKHTKLCIALLCTLALAGLAGLALGGIYLWEIQPQPIYPGDYNENIPYDDYIIKQESPGARENQRVYVVGDSAETINDLIRQASESGGGIVLVERGDWSVGTIVLRDNVTLWLAPGARLVASHKFRDFDGAMIKADGAKNIRITGGGVIDGQGEYFVKRPKQLPHLKPFPATNIRALREEYYARIRMGRARRPSAMVWLRGCENVRIDNIILRDSMAWTLKLDLSQNIVVEQMVIDNNRHVANTDGIDIVGSQDVTVRRCFISTADDGIVLKTPQESNQEPVRGVRVSDCEVQSCTNAFKIGTETLGEISDVVVENIRASLPGLYPGSVSGVSIESVDGAWVHDVTVRRFLCNGVTCPLFIRLGDRNRYGGHEGEGRLEHITITDLTAANAELPMLITGVENDKGAVQYIKNVSLDHISVAYRDNEEVLVLRDEVPEYAREYPENWRFLDVPAYGLWARHVDGLTLEGIEIKPRTANTREKYAFEDVIN